MKVWLPLSDAFLSETIWRVGLGNAMSMPGCCTCGLPLQSREPSVTAEGKEGSGHTLVPDLFWCEMCGEFFECKTCLLMRHQRTPLHWVEVHY